MNEIASARTFECLETESHPFVVRVTIGGSWSLDDSLDLDLYLKRIGPWLEKVHTVAFDTSALTKWDSALLSLLFEIYQQAHQREVVFDLSGLPSGLGALLELAFESPRRELSQTQETAGAGIPETVGRFVVSLWEKHQALVEFVGVVAVGFGRFVAGRTVFPWRDFLWFVQDCGARAFPIVSLISILVGLILAFIGILQLEQFAAQLYVANLVGIAMVREMGSMMVGIVMAGRTGAAYAAQLGTMQVNEEIDALETFGIRATDYLITPRVLALVLMMPLLCVYADVLGMIGGLLISVTNDEITFSQYVNQTAGFVRMQDVLVGLGKSVIYGIIVALAGCYRGFKCGRSAQAVGEAATAAVVTAIVLIIVADAVAAVVCSTLGL